MSGSADVFLRKYDSQGNALWDRQFGTAGEDQAAGVAADAFGNVYIGALLTLNPPGDTHGGLRKYDPQGNLLWSRVFGTPAAHDQLVGIGTDSLGNVYIAGLTEGAFPGYTNAGGRDAFIRKYDAAGNELWTRQFGTGGPDYGMVSPPFLDRQATIDRRVPCDTFVG